MPSTGGSSGSVDDTASSSRREGTVTLQYPLLTKSNYTAWAMKMEVYMQAQGVWEAIESEELVGSRTDRMAMAAIFHGISEETLLKLGVRKTAKEAWTALKTMHLGADRVKEVRAQSLKWELESTRMGETESVDDFTGKISTVVNKLRGLGEKVDETYVVKKMLRTVSPKFIQIASTIEEFGDLETKTIENVIGSLKAHEERLQGHDVNTEEKVLLSRTDWSNHGESSNPYSSTTKEFKPSKGRGRGRGRSQGGRGSQFDIKKVRCYNCNEYGHFVRDCKEEEKEENANLHEEVDEEPALLMTEICDAAHSDNVCKLEVVQL